MQREKEVFVLLQKTYGCLYEILVNYQSCYNSGKYARIDQVLKHICQKEGAVFGYNCYCIKEDSITIKRNVCVSKVILKNNMESRDFERDRRIRILYEVVFSFAM